MISFIIPTYNAAWNIRPLIESILAQKNAGDEVIIVEDCSSDDTATQAASYSGNRVRVIRMDQNSGPAACRNRGAREAAGAYLFFLDSDTQLEPGSVAAFREMIKARPDIRCVNGINRRGIDQNPAARYKAVLEYSWVENLPDFFDGSSCFNTRVGVIEKNLYLQTPGMNETYKKADVEDYEFGYEIIRKAKIYLNKKICVKHRFGSLKHITRNYIKRTLMWLELFRGRKQFDAGGTSFGSALEYAAGAAALGMTLLAIWIPSVRLLAGAAWLFFFFCSRRLLRLTAQEAGPAMIPTVLFFHLYFSVIISITACLGFFKILTGRAKNSGPPQGNPDHSCCAEKEVKMSVSAP